MVTVSKQTKYISCHGKTGLRYHYSHPCSLLNDFTFQKEYDVTPDNIVTLLLRSAFPSHELDRYCEVPVYMLHKKSHFRNKHIGLQNTLCNIQKAGINI